MIKLIALGLLVSIWSIPNSFAQVVAPTSAAPIITSFSPGSGTKDTVVRIIGQNFNNITNVSVGGVSYPFTLVSSSGLPVGYFTSGSNVRNPFAIDVTIGKFANTGPIIVSGNNGSTSTSGNNGLGHLGNGSFEALCKPAVNINKSLAINDTSVINHANAINNGPWSFNFLLSQMAPASMSPSTFIKKWILNWKNTVSLRNVNNAPTNTTASQGALSNLLSSWPRTAGSNEFDGTAPLNLAAAGPFKLVAIIFRPDLGDSAVPPLFAGEGRFIFKVNNSSDEVIFEYKLPISSGSLPTSADQWALKIHDLSTLPFSTSYISALLAVTDRFTKKTFPLNNLTVNGSGINQVRTNTIGLESNGWSLREFRLTAQAVAGSPSTVAAAAGELVSRITENSPSEQFNSAGSSGALVRTWITQNTASLLNNAAALNPALAGTLSISQTGAWQFPLAGQPGSVAPSVAKAFDMMTCRGCHSPSVNLSGNAGASNPFLQVSSGGYASFMTGNSSGSVANPQVSTTTPMPGLFGAPFTYNANGSVTPNVGYSDLHNRAHVLLNKVVSGYCR